MSVSVTKGVPPNVAVGVAGKSTTIVIPGGGTPALSTTKGAPGAVALPSKSPGVLAVNAPSGTTGSIGLIPVVGEIPAGLINGTNLAYTTANIFQSGTLAVYVNGLRMRIGPDYTITGAQSFNMVSALLTGDSLSVDYMR